MRRKIIAPVAICAIAALCMVQGCEKSDVPTSYGKAPESVKTYDMTNAVALSPMGEEIAYDYPAPREKTVGIFYFVWIGAHGYDEDRFGDTIVPPTPADCNSPYDISELEKGHTSIKDIPFGPAWASHHWGKPYFDYYVSNDEWVIRRHAQMLAAAGIDVIFLDLTNGYAYKDTIELILKIYNSIQLNGGKVPKLSFVLNTDPENVLPVLKSIYKSGNYNRHFFKYEGKPLVLCPEGARSGYEDVFTFRHCWYDTHGRANKWYGTGYEANGNQKWTWGDLSPMTPMKEEMSVLCGSHPYWNIGRSYSGNNYGSADGSQPMNSTPEMRAQGIFFHQQFEEALAADPDLLFVTGWNEWIAQKQEATGNMTFLGEQLSKGDSYFVDCYNHEFSRDIEPCANDFKDTYYYYLAEYVRKFKGVSPVEPVARLHKIDIDGNFADWGYVETRYKDYSFDTEHRNHYGFGYRIGTLTNETGRNDIVYTKVTTDSENLYFYAETSGALTDWSDGKWMRLFIDVKGNADSGWEGFQYLVNDKVISDKETTLKMSESGWKWVETAKLSYAAGEKQIEIAIPLKALGINDYKDFTIDFKWVDNAIEDGDICECMKDGDSAPDSRWRYRYIFKKN